MRFDSTLYYHVGQAYSWGLLFNEMRETVELLDQLHFNGVWLAEHHFAWDGWYRSASNPILLGAEVARWSDRLRLGQCGLVLPDWHPLRLAEDIAFLDQMTKGRVDIGIAPGINSRACEQFHPAGDRRDRDRNRALYEESAAIIIKALGSDVFNHVGDFYRFPAGEWIENNPMAHDPKYHDTNGKITHLGITPRPYQTPRPPMWAMSESIEAHEFCAINQIGTMSQSLSNGRIKQNWEHYRQVANRHHNNDLAMGQGLALMRYFYCAETMQEALDAVRPGYEKLGAWSPGNPLRVRTNSVLDEEFEDGDENLSFLDFQIKHDIALIGTPESISEQIRSLQQDLNCEHIALFLNIPNLGIDRVLNSLSLFGTEVMPNFQKESDRSRAGIPL